SRRDVHADRAKMTNPTLAHGTAAATTAGRRRASATSLVVGPVPPPYHGGAVATRNLLQSPVADRFRLVHLDTTDRRGLENIGRLDARNVGLAFTHFARFVRLLRRERPELVYVPLAQSRLGFLRDALFLLAARAAGSRVVVHFHGGGFREFYDESDPVTSALMRAFLCGAARSLGHTMVHHTRVI